MIKLMYNNKDIKEGKGRLLIVIEMIKKFMVMLISLTQETNIIIIIKMPMNIIIRETTKCSRIECNKEVANIINITLFGDCYKIKKIAIIFLNFLLCS
jgi:hypothetical protein